MSRLSEAEIQARRERARVGARAALDDEDAPRVWWWLSFTDPDKPAGSQFLGVAIVDTPLPDDELAQVAVPMMRAWDLGINPGGQVGTVGPFETIDEVPATHRNRLLTTRAELEAVGADLDVQASGGGAPVDEQPPPPSLPDQ